jgi:UDP-N-acetylglucosamine 4-epimerase
MSILAGDGGGRANMTMMAYERTKTELVARPKRWLVTGAAGFIGSNLVEELLRLDQTVIGLDNFATGHRHNLADVLDSVGPERRPRFELIEADIRDAAICRRAVQGVDCVLHQAALGSVPRSLADPIASNAANVDGFLSLMVAAKDAGVGSFVYAASSSTYGDDPTLPKVEDRIGAPLSPYAVTKLVNELYAGVFRRCYGFSTIGLRYFNVFGPRQDPAGAYAAVIPRWTLAMIRGEPIVIHGDGSTSRDFCFVANAVQANILAACAPRSAADQVYNVAVGGRTSLLELAAKLRAALALHQIRYDLEPLHAPERAGDVRHSQADIAKAATMLGYEPSDTVDTGLAKMVPWYIAQALAGNGGVR